LARLVSRWTEPGAGERCLLSLLRGHRLKRLLLRTLDENEFLSTFGVRSLSKAYEKEPYGLDHAGMRLSVPYTPGEATSGLFGGNSNWRGPIWMPVNFLMIDALRKFHAYFGPDFRVECPSGSSQRLNLSEVADELSQRLARLFLQQEDGTRPALFGVDRGSVIGNNLLFHEYFNGDTGRGQGATHQTGWTALIANLLATREVGGKT
jgi:hypothetical protein